MDEDGQAVARLKQHRQRQPRQHHERRRRRLLERAAGRGANPVDQRNRRAGDDQSANTCDEHEGGLASRNAAQVVCEFLRSGQRVNLLAGDHQPCQAQRLAVDDRRKAPHILAAGPFDLDHLGAGFRQYEARQRPRQQRGEIQNKETGERLHEST